MTAPILLAVSVLLVLACGAFVAAEFSLVTVDRATVDRAAEAGDQRAAGVQLALRSLSTQLSGAQVGITVTNLAIGFLAEPAVATLIREPLGELGVSAGAVPGVAIGIGIFTATMVTMVFGELVPKNLAIAEPFAVARATQGFQRLFTGAIRQPIRLLNGSANQLVRRVGVEPQEELRSARSSQELRSLISRSASEGTLDPQTAGLMQRSVAFSGRTAGEIMTPRVRMDSVREDDTAATVILKLARTTGHSRFPVVGTQDDDVVGAIHVKHAVAVPRGERATARVGDLMVDVAFVPETLRLDPLMAALRQEGFQVAVVADEYGGTAGVVTLEDVLEEIVGEISDEHDPLDTGARRRDDAWSLSGLLRPDEVAERTGVGLPEHENYDTLAGLFLHASGQMPTVGDQVEVPLPVAFDPDGALQQQDVAVLTVERMVGLRIDRILMTTRPASRGEGS